jgi:hypothetical protein
VRARGAVKVALIVRRAGRTFEHREGVPLRPGDEVRLSVESAGGGFLTVLGPAAGDELAPYYEALAAPAGTFTVPDSLVLDAHVGPEQWIVALSPEPLAARVLAARLRRGDTPRAAVTVVRITKEPAP